MMKNKLILAGWHQPVYQILRPATHDDDAQTFAIDVKSMILINVVYGAPSETGLRYLEHTKAG
jgi:hypothetical protein